MTVMGDGQEKQHVYRKTDRKATNKQTHTHTVTMCKQRAVCVLSYIWAASGGAAQDLCTAALCTGRPAHSLTSGLHRRQSFPLFLLIFFF